MTKLMNDLFLAGFLTLVFGPVIGLGIVVVGRCVRETIESL
jgi:hypothetical protein